MSFRFGKLKKIDLLKENSFQKKIDCNQSELKKKTNSLLCMISLTGTKCYFRALVTYSILNADSLRQTGLTEFWCNIFSELNFSQIVSTIPNKA